MELAHIDSTVEPPALRILERFNAAYDLIERNLRAGRADKTAYTDDAGSYTYRELAAELKAFVKSRLAPYKYPRWIEFVTELPKTVTGKIQRFKLRAPCKSTP